MLIPATLSPVGRGAAASPRDKMKVVCWRGFAPPTPPPHRNAINQLDVYRAGDSPKPPVEDGRASPITDCRCHGVEVVCSLGISGSVIVSWVAVDAVDVVGCVPA